MGIYSATFKSWQKSDENNSKIVDMGGWYNLETVEEKAPNRAGVYVFVNVALQVKYVGKAGDGRLKEEIKNAIYREKDSGATKFAWFATNSDDNAKKLESEWINKYNPINNLTSK